MEQKIMQTTANHCHIPAQVDVNKKIPVLKTLEEQ